MTVTPPKFIAKPLEASVIEKIELSLSQCLVPAISHLRAVQ